LVKWWLLAVPHYFVVAFFAGGAFALIAGFVLLVRGRYPRGIYDLVMGFNRWVFRVAAYASSMTDTYPPFRLDMGGHEPPTQDAFTSATSSPKPVTA
jgi:hypothetical protein